MGGTLLQMNKVKNLKIAASETDIEKKTDPVIMMNLYQNRQKSFSSVLESTKMASMFSKVRLLKMEMMHPMAYI